jgi:uncharacterized protein (DUF1684 family)
MRVGPIGVFALFLSVVTGQAQSTDDDWRLGLEAYWAEIDSAYGDTLHSPLPKEDRFGFKGLERFPFDPQYRVMARFEPAEGPIFGMKTSTEREPKYRSVGSLIFSLEGKEHRLTVYKNIDLARLPDYINYLFVPFTDLTNGEETYGGGRYIDLSGPLSQEVEIDLNRAYNPYCAYGGAYSCPIPPPENHLEVAVRAGVKKYH